MNALREIEQRMRDAVRGMEGHDGIGWAAVLDFADDLSRAIKAMEGMASCGVEGLREGNWHHPDGGRIVGWVIEPDDLERMKADAFCLPREVAEALQNLRARHATSPSGADEIAEADD